ncbi:toxin-antitoxin system YwqK family antitoxin [Saccharicrinis sp. GN24d3]|uniref:toxin-antitoxin system YwqK family antitoxin n=1 Tax=Saccharicrinis sp. GN24d3 TaxID=3458416 RepID=UPI004036B67C
MRILFISILSIVFSTSLVVGQITDVFGNNVPARQGASTKGVSSEHNKKDEQGLKQGYWEKRFSNGKPAYTVTFKDDKPVGKMTRYYFNGNKKVVVDYNEDQYGKAILYSENGKISAKGFYQGTQKDSLWQFFSPEGVLYTKESYKEGLKNGITTHFFKKGNVAEEVEWKDDVKDGIWKKYHENGQLKMTSSHKDGKIEGEYIVFYPDGKPEVQGKFEHGLEEGTWLVFTHAGNLAYKIEYKEGKTLNAADFDEQQQSLFEEFEKNKGKIKDPEEFKHDPDSYLKGM